MEPAEETCDLSGAYAACKQVFGIIAISRAVPCPKEKEAILATDVYKRQEIYIWSPNSWVTRRA